MIASCGGHPFGLATWAGAVAILGAIAARQVDPHDRERRRWELLRDMGQELLGAGLDIGRICEVVACRVRSLAPYLVFAILLPDVERLPIVATLEADESLSIRTRSSSALGIWDWLSQNPRPLLVDDARESAPPFAPLSMVPSVLSGMYVPLVGTEGLLGALVLESAEARAYTADDLEVVAIVAAQASLGLESAQQASREQRRSAMLLLIAEVSRKVAAMIGLDTLFGDTVRLVQQALGYYVVSVFTVSEDRERLVLRASSNPIIQSRGFFVRRGEGLMGHAAESGHRVLVDDVRTEPRFLPDSALERTRSELAIPLRVESRVLGVLDLQSDCAKAFTPDDAATLQILADQIAIAVEDSRTYERQQEHLWVNTALLQVADAVAAQRSPEGISRTVVRLAQMLAGADRCLALLWDDGTSAYVVAESAGFDISQTRALAGLRIRPAQLPLLDSAVRDGEAAVCRASALAGFLEEGGEDWGSRRAIFLPLRSTGQSIGALVAVCEGTAEPSDAQRSILQGIASYAAVALENARLIVAQSEETWVSTALLQVANVIGRADNAERQGMATVVRLAAMLLGAPWCALLRWHEETLAFEEVASYLADRGDLDGSGALIEQLRYVWTPASRATSDPQPLVLRDGVVAMACALTARDHTLGVLLVGATPGQAGLPSRQSTILAGIASQAASALERSILYEKAVRQERLEHEMRLAQEIQVSFLPECAPDIPGWDVAVEWRAARVVGGDFYDFVRLDDRHLGVLIADVSDKGVAAALYMALARTVIRAAASGLTSPAATLERANGLLVQDARSGMFVSAFYAVVDLGSGSIRCARAGHTPAFIRRSGDGAVHIVQPPGILLGITDDPLLGEEAAVLGPGDLMVLYTDGVTEALEPQSIEPAEDGLAALLETTPCDSARELVDGIHRAAERLGAPSPLNDDYTLVVLRRRSAAEMATGRTSPVQG